MEATETNQEVESLSETLGASLVEETSIDPNMINKNDSKVDIIIADIFNTAETNLWKPTEKIPHVKNAIDILTKNLKAFLEESDYEINSILDGSRDLYEESKVLIDEMTVCKNEVEKETIADILKSIENHDIVSKELIRVEFALSIVDDLIQCNKFFCDFDECVAVKSYSRAVKIIQDLLEMLEYPNEGFKSMSMYTNVKFFALSRWQKLLLDILAQWHLMVSWRCEELEKSTSIAIFIKLDESPSIIDVINALNTCKQLKAQLGALGKFLLDDILVPMMHKDCTVQVNDDGVINIEIDNKDQPKPPYEKVLSNLQFVLNAVGKKLDFDARIGMPLMEIIGDEIGAQFADILIKDCLTDTVPYNIADLENYRDITIEVDKFQCFLKQIKFFRDNEISILRYTKDIDVLFSEKSSQYFLNSAREIMLKDLSDSMSIGVESIADDGFTESNQSEEDSAALKVFNEVLPKSLFYFPRCMISRTTRELLDLIYAMMEQAMLCPELVAKRLYCTARLVFELYDAVVPYHHENFLQNIPQYVALFHNNCMYLAHNLQTLGYKWLQQMEGQNLDYPVSFIDLVPKLRALGCKHLAIHMQQQRKQILDNIRSSDLNCIVVKDVLGENAEQAIRQCLRQLQILKNVWIGVFPINVFTKLMSTLVHMFLEELIHRVCSVEDISAEMASQLTEMYSLVVKKAPNLFQKPEDIESTVESWVKMQELILVLNGSLKDIENRWSDGNGPLGKHFSKDELRNLIKALFQNTQFRANLLSKIK